MPDAEVTAKLMRLPLTCRHRQWRFGSIQLTESSLELHVKRQLVPLERKPMQVLLVLLYRHGELVRKEELFEVVWRGRALSDAALTKCIAVLRRALGDRQHSIIKTVHGYGYRLVAPVRVVIERSRPYVRLTALQERKLMRGPAPRAMAGSEGAGESPDVGSAVPRRAPGTIGLSAKGLSLSSAHPASATSTSLQRSDTVPRHD